MKKKIVYILGLSRTGSTLLDLVLGSNPGLAGVGEVFFFLHPELGALDETHFCTCGKVVGECPFWGKTIKILKQNEEKSLADKYMLVVEEFYSFFGPETLMVDSSKKIDLLKTLLKIEELHVKVIYLVRDVRAWTTSRLKKRRKMPEIYSARGDYYKNLNFKYRKLSSLFSPLIPVATNSAMFYFLLWYFQNRRIFSFLKKSGADYIQIGYDQLGLHPVENLERICKFLGNFSGEVTLSSENSKSHVLVGSLQKADPKRRTGIFYDNRWMVDDSWFAPAFFFPFIMKYNSRHVFGNIGSQAWWDGDEKR